MQYLVDHSGFKLKGKTVLMVCAVDRLGMAKALAAAGCNMVFGDLIFALGINKPVNSFDQLSKLADELLPKICKTPFHVLYPIGAEQDKEPDPKYSQFYDEADIVAGDFHYIRKYMPKDMRRKDILTNTVTSKDVETLRERGVRYLITTTPEFQGRSFGTNVLEAALITLLDKPWEEVIPQDYLKLLKELDFKPRIERLD